MENRPIEFVTPSKRAFERMKDILFRPFDMQKWFILGFSAWLATLVEGGGSSGSGGGGDTSGFETDDFSLSDTLSKMSSWIQEHLMIILIIGGVVLLLIAVVVVALTWVQSRGKLMFIDNVMNNRARISEPWKDFRGPANSLFVWLLVYGGIVFLSLTLLIGCALFTAWPMMKSGSFDTGTIPVFVGLGAILIAMSLAAAYINVLLENFIIPLMHHDRICTTEAWKRFLSLHSRRTGSFVLFFLWTLLLRTASAFIILALVLGTCCIALIPLIIPYLGTVILLPVFVFFRLLGPEFLKQFGDEFDTMIDGREPPSLPA
ncbi:MAG: hypothetical protein P1U68_00960 [Verrucomicrobiales bacterium]|nr:hypothetical protein [Verrucomicrobiales bacterium]